MVDSWWLIERFDGLDIYFSF